MARTALVRSLHPLALTVLLLSPRAVGAESEPRYRVEDLAPGQPARINNAGEIAGRINVQIGTSGTQHAAVRRDGQWLDLGVFETDTASIGLGLNNLGVVVGQSSRTFSLTDSRYSAVRSGSNGLEAVPGVVPDSAATAINDSGQICGNLAPEQPDANKPWHAFVADGSTVTDFHAAVEAAIGGTCFSTKAVDVNAAGDVVGQATQAGIGNHGFVLRGGTLTILAGQDAANGTWSLYSPMAINDAGQIAGLATIGGPNTTRAVVYDATTGTLTQLGGSIGGQTVLSSEGHDIDATGRVVGTAVLEPGVRRAFLYENGAMVELDTLIPPGSGWALQWATAINDVGQIVGTGTFRGQAGHYFLLTPANEPPTVSLGGPYAVDEGGALTVTASAGDPEEGDVTFDWDLDGHDSYEVLDGGGEVVLDPAGGDGPAERTIGVRVTDKAGLTAMASTVVQILNVAPSASLSTSAVRVYVNASVTLSFSNPSDPSAADVAAGFSYAWDCDDDDFFEASGGSSHDCAYPVAGGRTTKGRIGDKDGAFSDYAVVIDVRTPQAGIAGLIGLVQGFGLPRGIETSFVKKLEGALRSLEAGNPEPACGELLAFINHARAQSGKALTDEQAEQIIGEAEALRLALGCV